MIRSLARAACLPGFLILATPAPAQEPLRIRFRILSDAGTARAAREALWARRQAHARTVIESVCTGCLGAWATVAGPEPSRIPDRFADLAAPTGVELDPGSGASDRSSDPTSSERHP